MSNNIRRRKLRGWKITSLISLVFGVVALPTLGEQNIESNTYSPAKIQTSSKPVYPIDRFKNNAETSVDDGQVEVHFMINADGTTAHPIVVRFSIQRFVEPTLRALAKRTYQPATMNGAPVASMQRETFLFTLSASDLSNNRGSTRSFAGVRDNGVPDGYQSYYDQFTKELTRQTPSQEQASNLLEKMIGLKHQSFYSLAYHSLARYRFAEQFQGRTEKIAALKDLVWYDPQVKEKHQILQGDLKDAIWTTLLKEQIEAGHYANALYTYSQIKKFRAEPLPFEETIQQISDLKQSDKAVARIVTLNTHGYDYMPLFKRHFTLADIKGEFSQFVLRCDAKYTELNYQQDAQYKIPTSWGECYLQIIGAPTSSATLLMQ